MGIFESKSVSLQLRVFSDRAIVLKAMYSSMINYMRVMVAGLTEVPWMYGPRWIPSHSEFNQCLNKSPLLSHAITWVRAGL